MDELPLSLKIDPLELRLRCYSDRNQNTDQPFSSEALGHLRRRRRTTAIAWRQGAWRNRHSGRRGRDYTCGLPRDWEEGARPADYAR